MAQPHTAADYLAALQALMPRGPAWPTDPTATQTAVLQALAQAFAAEDETALDLLIDAFPATATNLLTEWEETLGLPDPCEGTDQTLQQRRNQVVTRLASLGGQSVAHLLQVAASLGYVGVSIYTYAPFRARISHAGDRLYDDAWAYAFRVNVPDLRIFYFEAGVSAAGEPLYTIENGSITCVIDEIKPAHTVAIYTSDGSLTTEDGLLLETEAGDDLATETA